MCDPALSLRDLKVTVLDAILQCAVVVCCNVMKEFIKADHL